MHNEAKNVQDQKTRSNVRGSLRKNSMNIQALFEAFRLDPRRRRAQQGGSSKSATSPRPYGSDCRRQPKAGLCSLTVLEAARGHGFAPAEASIVTRSSRQKSIRQGEITSPSALNKEGQGNRSIHILHRSRRLACSPSDGRRLAR